MYVFQVGNRVIIKERESFGMPRQYPLWSNEVQAVWRYMGGIEKLPLATLSINNFPLNLIPQRQNMHRSFSPFMSVKSQTGPNLLMVINYWVKTKCISYLAVLNR